jgi:FlaG/FlaF family flagellin (archaellin)
MMRKRCIVPGKGSGKTDMQENQKLPKKNIGRQYSTRRSMKMKDEAVSAVVGVMLMLTVTIIIAAVISAYAGGLGGTKEKSSQVTFTASACTPYISFDHMGGDAVNLDDVRIVLDQGINRISITKSNIDQHYGHDDNYNNLSRKGSLDNIILSGDAILLEGVKNSSDNRDLDFKTDNGFFTIDHDKTFTWTLLSQRGSEILARGTLILHDTCTL